MRGIFCYLAIFALFSDFQKVSEASTCSEFAKSVVGCNDTAEYRKITKAMRVENDRYKRTELQCKLRRSLYWCMHIMLEDFKDVQQCKRRAEILSEITKLEPYSVCSAINLKTCYLCCVLPVIYLCFYCFEWKCCWKWCILSVKVLRHEVVPMLLGFLIFAGLTLLLLFLLPNYGLHFSVV